MEQGNMDGTPEKKALHYIGDVRFEQGVTYRTMARNMGINVKDTQELCKPDNDISLSVLYRVAEVLGVPAEDLLNDDSSLEMSSSTAKRAKMIRLMKTLRALMEESKSKDVLKLATMLEESLIEIMPETAEIHPWRTMGQRRSSDEIGKTGERILPDPEL